MSKKQSIDYSKWDNIGDSDDDDDSAEEKRYEQKLPPGFSAEQCRKSCYEGKMINGGLSSKDFFPAYVLLNMVSPDGMKKRSVAKRKGEQLGGALADPVHINLWELTMKLRVGPEQADELLRHNVYDRLLEVIRSRNLSQYKPDERSADQDFAQMLTTRMESIQPPTTKEERNLAHQLTWDIKDTHYTISVFHEMCRYRAGCVAMAEHKSLLVELMSIPIKRVTKTAMRSFIKFGFDDIEIGWWPSYHFGMIEQGILDTMGRLINGLDQNKTLRKKVCCYLSTQLDTFETAMHTAEEIIEKGSEDPCISHCINLKLTLAKLRKSVKNPDDARSWRSTYRIDRNHLPLKSEQTNAGVKVKEEGFCHFCRKHSSDLKRCSRCRSVSYCGRECQGSDWKEHKKDCVEQRGFSTAQDSTQSDYHKSHTVREEFAEMMRKSREKLASDEENHHGVE